MNSKKLAVFISGRGSNFKAVLDGIDNGEICANVELVFSNTDADGLNYAREKNIEHYITNDFEKIDNILEEKKIEGILLLGYLKILPEYIINKYKNKIINIHPSLIPSFCGKGFYGEKVHRAVLERGVKVTGVTTHFVDAEADSGPIILQEVVDVDFDDTVEKLSKKVLDVEHELIVETVSLFSKDRLLVEGSRVKILWTY